MKSKKLSRTVQYSANDMYALVSDIESYPYFVPACKSLEVIKKRKDGDIIYIDAIMEVGYGFLNEFFTSHIILNKKKFTIEVVNSDGPFRKLNNYWQFIDIENGSEILFEIDFIAKIHSQERLSILCLKGYSVNIFLPLKAGQISFIVDWLTRMRSQML